MCFIRNRKAESRVFPIIFDIENNSIRIKLSAFVSWVVCNRIAQTRWLRFYPLTCVEATSPKSRVQKAHTHSEGTKKDFFLLFSFLLVTASIFWCSLACNCITLIYASVFIDFSPLCVSLSLHDLLIRQPSKRFRYYSNPAWLHPN